MNICFIHGFFSSVTGHSVIHILYRNYILLCLPSANQSFSAILALILLILDKGSSFQFTHTTKQTEEWKQVGFAEK